MSKIHIEYAALPNPNGGFIPTIWVNGHNETGSWLRVGFGESEALEMAKQRALEEAERFSGDWDLVVEPRGARLRGGA